MTTIKILFCALTILGSGVAIAESATAESLKEINFNGGEIRFKIPANWKEEYGKNGNGAFYEDAPDSGTLRLYVITLEAPPDAKGNLLMLALSSIPGVDRQNIKILGNGNALGHAAKRSDEDGKQYSLYWWYLANFVPPDYVRLATYSFAILTSKENDKKTREELGLLEREIEKAVFQPGLGK